MFSVATITFGVTHLLGTPVALLVGNTATKAAIRAATIQLGLNKPLYIQYWHFLWQTIHGNLGRSTHTFNAVSTDISQRFPVTLELVGAAMVIAVIVGLALGAASAIWERRPPDLVGQAVVQISLSIPSFWLGLMLVYVFFVKYQLLPAPIGQLAANIPLPHRITGMVVVDSLFDHDGTAFVSALQHLVLPAFTLSLVAVPSILQITRTTMISVMRSDYVRLGRAYGLRRSALVFKYGLRNAVAPIITVVAMSFGYLMSGTVLVEEVFAWPGLGLYAVTSMNDQDYQPIVALVMLSAVFYCVSYLFADIVSALADPRVMLDGS
jgi:peptide/nickel transport system permease protein